MDEKARKRKELIERVRRDAENHPRVLQLRELERRGWAELAARAEADRRATDA